MAYGFALGIEGVGISLRVGLVIDGWGEGMGNVSIR